MRPAGRNRQRIKNVQHRDGYDVSGEKPIGNIDVFDLAFYDGAEEHDAISHPYHGDQYIDGPNKLSVFLALG